MNNIIEVIVELSRMQGQAIDRAQAEVLNTAIEQGYDKYQASKTFNLNKSKDIG
jgi:diacylglycerol kinase